MNDYIEIPLWSTIDNDVSGDTRLFLTGIPKFISDKYGLIGANYFVYNNIHHESIDEFIRNYKPNYIKRYSVRPEDIHFPEGFKKEQEKIRISFPEFKSYNLENDAFNEWYNKQSPEQIEMINSLLAHNPSQSRYIYIIEQ